jgi:hypothetical protein
MYFLFVKSEKLSVAQKQQVFLFATQNKDMTNLAIAEKFFSHVIKT